MAIAGNLLPANAESVETDASAWVAVLNAGSLVRASGGTLGSFSLRWTTTTAGDSQVGLAARVAVTPNVEYWACASVFPPALSSSARIEIRWYTSGGSLISTSQGPVTTSTATWGQVGAVGAAPATAATADVVVRATATASAQNWYLDRAFLGLTSTSVSTGNLLPFNTETFEVDTSGWLNSFMATLGISTSAANWYQSLLVTSQAAASVLVRTQTAQAPTVTPGVEYAAYAYVTPGTAGLTQKIQIYWLDSGGAEISISSADWVPATGSWTRCVVVATAPAGAVKARVGLSPQATAAGQQWVYDRVVLAPTSALMTSGNLLPYNVSDVEQDVTGWTVTGATKTHTTEQVLGGAYAMKLVATGGDIVVSTTVTGVTPGIGYQFIACTRKPTTAIHQTRIEWLDGSGNAIRTRWQNWSGAALTWLAGAMGDLAPEGAVGARISFIAPSATAGQVFYYDRAEWRIGGLTVRAVPADGGGAAITVRGLTSGGPTWKWSLERIVAGEAPQPVRGWTGDIMSQPITGDVAVVTDHEAPLGVEVQWRATIQNPVGAGRFSYASDAVVLPAETLDLWIKDPGLPARNARATVQTLPDWQRAARQGINAVRGRSRPIVISDVRTSRTGTTVLVTHTEDEKDALWWVLDTGNTLLLQWPPGWGEKDVYVSVGDVTEAHITELAEHSDRAWTLALTEVDRPFGGIVGSASRTWETVSLAGADWADALYGATTWLDVYTGVVGS